MARVSRTKEERAEIIDQKIIKVKEDLAELAEKRKELTEVLDQKEKTLKDRIKKLEKQKTDIFNPKPRKKTKKQKMKELFNIMSKSGYSPEELAEKLGVEIEENN